MLGCHSFCFRERPLDGALRGAAAAGFTNVELWHGHAPWTGDPEEVRGRLEAAGLGISSYCVGGFYSSTPDVGVRARTAFAFAQRLGTELVTGCLAADLYRVVGSIAADAGVRFAVENHWYQALSRPRDLKAVTDVGLGLSLDTGHALLARARPDAFARLAGSRLDNVHLKDVDAVGPSGRLPVRVRRRFARPPAGSLPIGEGGLDLSELVSALREVGYGGPIAVEVEASRDPVRDLRRSLGPASALVSALR